MKIDEDTLKDTMCLIKVTGTGIVNKSIQLISFGTVSLRKER